MTAIPPSPPSSHPSFPPLIFLLSHFPFCIWHLVFVCAVNTLGTSRRNPSFSPCRTTNTHVLHISHIVSDQHFVFSVTTAASRRPLCLHRIFPSFLCRPSLLLSLLPVLLSSDLKWFILNHVQQITVRGLHDCTAASGVWLCLSSC